MFKIINNNKIFIIFAQKNTVYLFKNYLLHTTSTKIMDLSYTGKTYKWNLKLSFFKFIFNRAHKTNLFFFKKLFYKKLSKNKLRFFLTNYNQFNVLTILIKKIRRYNIFTQRGLKIKQNYIFKKRGKVSTYR